MGIRVALLLLTFLLCHVAKGQIPGMIVYSNEQGFPGATPYLVTQDSRGFIWVGTDHGAVRFDGNSFQVYDEQDGLEDKEILHVLPDDSGRVFFIPILNQIQILDGGKTYPLRGLNNRDVNQVYRDSRTGRIWIFDAENSGQIQCVQGDSLKQVEVLMNRPYRVFGVHNNKMLLSEIWMDTTDFQLGIYDLNAKQFLPFRKQGVFVDASFLRWYDEAEILVAKGESRNEVEMFAMHQDTPVFKARFPLQNRFRELHVDVAGNIWIWYQGGGLQFWAESDPGRVPVNLFPDQEVQGLCTDRDHNLWLTIKDVGLVFISQSHWQNAVRLQQKGLLELQAKSIFVDSSGRFLWGHLKESKITESYHGRLNVHSFSGDAANGIKSIHRFGEHLIAVNQSNLIFIEGPLKGQILDVGGSIKDVAYWAADTILVATHHALIQLSSSDEDLKLTELNFGRGTCLEKTQDGILWLGTPNGLFRMANLQTPKERVSESSIAHASITDMISMPGGELLVGTAFGGLFLHGGDTREFETVENSDSLRPGYIRKLVVRNDSAIWIASDRGIFRLLLTKNQSWTLQPFEFQNDLPSEYISDLVEWQDTLYFITPEGVGIAPIQIQSTRRSQNKKVWISRISSSGQQKVFPQQWESQSPVGQLDLELSSLSFGGLKDRKIAYRLDSDESWKYTTTTSLTFSRLPPDSYEFQTQLVDRHKMPLGPISSMPITIHPAFWQTYWFIGLVLLFSIGVLATIAIWAISFTRRKKWNQLQQKRKLAELELEAIKAQINPHFIYNCLNSIQYFVYQGKVEEVRLSLERFAQLIRHTLQFSQQNFVTLEEELEYLQNYMELERMRFGEQLKVQIDVDPDLHLQRLIPAMVVQPYLENAIKHGVSAQGESLTIQVKFKVKGESLTILVEDDGPGIIPAQSDGRRKKLGHRISGSRLKSYHQLYQLDLEVQFSDLKSSSSGRSGARVTLLIPPISYENIRI
ncbi:histidine kinase [bacterium SCSIO 12741]|nr:histidine kinase [bacterium SCSIO 12741]